MQKRILFVDDEPHVLQGLARGLHRMREEWHMVFVGGGKEALGELGRAPFDAIVTDIRMPEMDGAELLAEVKQRYPQMTRIVLTAGNDRREVLRTGDLTHQYLLKPCDPEVLVALVKARLVVHDMTASRAAAGAALPPRPIARPPSPASPVPFPVATLEASAPTSSKDKVPTDVNQAIKGVISLTRAEWEDFAEVKRELDPNLPLVPFLAGEFRLLLFSFVLAAAHAAGEALSQGDFVRAVISLSTRRDGGWVEIRVHDPKTVLPVEEQRQIFKQPQRGGKSVWLPAAHAMIVDRHGGTLSIESQAGQGTTYLIRLPALTMQAAHERRDP